MDVKTHSPLATFALQAFAAFPLYFTVMIRVDRVWLIAVPVSSMLKMFQGW